MFRVALLTKKNEVKSKNFENREIADIWILKIDEKESIKKAIIENKETKEREIINF